MLECIQREADLQYVDRIIGLVIMILAIVFGVWSGAGFIPFAIAGAAIFVGAVATNILEQQKRTNELLTSLLDKAKKPAPPAAPSARPMPASSPANEDALRKIAQETEREEIQRFKNS